MGKRYSLVTDTHGDMIDHDAEGQFFDWLADYAPSIRVHMGDAFDFRAWRRGASAAEQSESMGYDLESGLGFLKRYKPTVWMLGNHDDRLWRIAREGKGDQRDLARMMIGEIEKALPKTKIVPYSIREGVARLGDMALLHGFQANMHVGRMIAQQYGGGEIRRVVQGHVHRFSSYTARDYGGTTGHTIGGLVQVVMDYNKSQTATLSHQNGWAFGELMKDGTTTFAEHRLAFDVPEMVEVG